MNKKLFLCIFYVLYCLSLTETEANIINYVGIKAGASTLTAGKTIGVEVYELYIESVPVVKWDKLYLSTELSLGLLHESYLKDKLGVVSNFSLKINYKLKEHISAYISLGPSYFSKHTFLFTNMGGPFQFKISGGFKFKLNKNWNIITSYAHYSNAYIYGEFNSGLDIISLGLERKF